MKQQFYAGKSINNKVRLISSSGGIFLELSKYVLSIGGIVYGAVYNANFEVVHERADNIDDVLKMMGSKYSKSDTMKAFSEVAKDLKQGKTVLFSGTPCQIYALNRKIKDFKNNLITIDVVCHGTPEKKYLNDYIQYQQDVFKSKIKKINMRYKSEKEFQKKMRKKHVPIGRVEPHIMEIEFENGKKYSNRSDYDVFYQLFDYFISKGCFMCPFANTNRNSDITIGDFHEFSSKLGDFNDGNGVSLIIVNSQKGKKIIDNLKNELVLIEKKKEECLQPAIQSPAIEPKNKKSFEQDYNKYGFKYVVKKYRKKGYKYKLKKLLYMIGILDKIMIIKRNKK